MTMTGEGISKIMKWKHGTGRPTYFLGRHTGDPCRYEWIYSAHDGAHALESRSPLPTRLASELPTPGLERPDFG
jgi:hypothetical protein